MSFYDTYILPRLTHWVCSGKDFQGPRSKMVPQARGRVLEIGIGSGLNLPFYDPSKVEMLWGLDPSPALKKIARSAAGKTKFNVEFIGLTGEDIPLESNSADTVLMTYTLCSIPDAVTAVSEMKRVLKPGGELIFCEHGRSPDPAVNKWQKTLNPAWKKISGGCHLDRHVPQLIRQGGFTVKVLETGYKSALKLTGYNFMGTAV